METKTNEIIIKVMHNGNPNIKNPLIYKTDKQLKIGEVITVPLGKKKALGIVVDILSNNNNNNIGFEIKNIIKDSTNNEYIKLNITELKIIKHIIKEYFSMIPNAINIYLTNKIKDNNNIIKNNEYTKNIDPIKLTKEQKIAIQNIIQKDKKYNKFLLFGKTGSGKTQVYIETIKNSIENGQQVLILLPDIAITSQIYTIIKENFNENIIATIHSKISKKQKCLENNLIRKKKKMIIIGARSSIFSRFNDLGTIIIDEFQDDTYKQEKDPKYNTIDIAKFIINNSNNNTKLILGSATPTIEEYFNANNDNTYKILTLNKRIHQYSKNYDKKNFQVNIVDLKKEGNYKEIISEELKKEIISTKKQKKKIILYVNRRGYAPIIICNKCGYIERCPRCNIPLVSHITEYIKGKDKYSLKCHHCEYTKNTITICPICKNKLLKYSGIGTQMIDKEIKKIFNNKVNTYILDKDSVQKKNLDIYNSINNKKIDIIIGTKLITRGWDIDNIRLIGIIFLDTEFSLPDFRSTEKVYQLITQIIGRGRRKSTEGMVIIQTNDPLNKVLKLAVDENFQEFYKNEIELRQKFKNPPFTKFIKITIKSKKENLLEKKAKEIIISLKKAQNIQIYQPIKSIPYKIRFYYRVNVIIKYQNELNKNTWELIRSISKYQKASIDSNPKDLF